MRTEGAAISSKSEFLEFQAENLDLEFKAEIKMSALLQGSTICLV